MLPWFEQNRFPLYLAPMAGFTDTVYRQLCKQEGADVMVTEFVMSDPVLRDLDEVWEIVDFTEDQHPLGIQIFGHDPSTMAEAAKCIVDRCKPDFIDLNFGCPSEKVTCQMAGASLLRTPDKLVDMSATVVKALPNTPVTAKTRLGWDAESIVAHEIAPRLQDVGIQALTIHGRTKEQEYAGRPNWNIIADIAESVEMPIIGNGNIRTSEQVQEIKAKTNIKGAMIGRGAQGYPWIFKEIKACLLTGKSPTPPSLEERWETILRYANLLGNRPMRQQGSDHIRWMRSKILKLTRDMHGSKKLRLELNKIEQLEDLAPLAERHLARYAHADQLMRERQLPAQPIAPSLFE